MVAPQVVGQQALKTPALRLLLLLVILLILTGSFWIARDNDISMIEGASYLYEVDQSEINYLSVQTPIGRKEFHLKPDGWYFTDPPNVPVNTERWGGIVLLLTGPKVERLLPKDVDVSQLGFGQGSRMSIKTSDGETFTLVFGDKTVGQDAYYVKAEWSGEIVTINVAWVEAITRLSSVPPLPYWFYQVDPSAIRVFEIESKHGTVTYMFGELETQVIFQNEMKVATRGDLDKIRLLLAGPAGFKVLPENGKLPGSASGALEATVRLAYTLPIPTSDRTDFGVVFRLQPLQEGEDFHRATTLDAPNLSLAFDRQWVRRAIELTRDTAIK